MAEPSDSPGLVQLGQLLESKRRADRKSARQVAQAAGISPVYLRVIETASNPKTSRASRPSIEILLALSQELELDRDDLLRLAGYPPVSMEDEAEPSASEAAGPDYRGEIARIQRDLVKARTRPTDFMRDALRHDLAQFASHVAAVAEGTLRCSADDERRLRILALRHAVTATLDSVVHRRAPWWLTDASHSYLREHKFLWRARTHIRLRRVFILAPASLESYSQVLDAHADAGISIFIADPSSVPMHTETDFTIYDSSLLQIGPTSPSDADAWMPIEFTDEVGRLGRAEMDFASILSISQPASPP